MPTRYFRHTKAPESDALYVRCDGEDQVTVVTRDGRERAPHHPWSLAHCLMAVAFGGAEEISAAEAAAMRGGGRPGGNTKGDAMADPLSERLGPVTEEAYPIARRIRDLEQQIRNARVGTEALLPDSRERALVLTTLAEARRWLLALAEPRTESAG